MKNKLFFLLFVISILCMGSVSVNAEFEENVIHTIDFEEYEEGKKPAWVTVPNGDSGTIEKDEDGTKALKLVKTDKNQQKLSFNIGLPKTTKKVVEVSFEAKFQNGVKRLNPFAQISAGADIITWTYGAGRTIRYGTPANTGNVLNTETCDGEKYYLFTIKIDFSKRKYSIYLDGVKKGGDYDFSTKNQAVDYLDKISFAVDGWTTTNNSESSRPGTATYWFDNFEVKECIYPEIQEVFPPDNSENVSIENKDISVRLNCPVLAESVNAENVIVYKNGEMVTDGYEAIADGENVRIKFKENLDYASLYKVELKTGITMDSESKRTLLEEYSFSFVTQPKPMRIKSVKLIDPENNKEVSAVTDVTGEKVKVSLVLVNEYEEAKTYSVIAGIYSEENMMVDATVSAGTVESKSELSFDYELDATDAKSLKVFLWNGFSYDSVSLDETIEK